MALCFGGDWNDSLEDDYDICLGVSSDMRESIENYYYYKEERSPMIIKANEAYKNCEKEIKKIHKAVNKCIEDLIMPTIQEKSKDMLGYNFYTWEFTPYYKIANRNFSYEHPSGVVFCQRLIQKLEDYGYTVEQNCSIIRVFWCKYQADNMSNNAAKDKEIARLKEDNQVYRDMLNSLLNEEVYHLDNATMTNIKYELNNRR